LIREWSSQDRPAISVNIPFSADHQSLAAVGGINRAALDDFTKLKHNRNRFVTDGV
jgi:hypothetical protein